MVCDGLAMESSAGQAMLRAALELSPRLISKLKKSCEISQYMQCTLHSLSPFNAPEETLSAIKMKYYAKLFILLIYTL